MRLINQLKLVINRGSVGEGYYQDGEWVNSSSVESINIRCSIQPFGTAKEHRIVAPAGFTARDAQVVFTKTKLKTVDQFSVAEADRATIDNHEYIAKTVENWSRHNIRSSHYQVLFVRRDLSPNGTI